MGWQAASVRDGEAYRSRWERWARQKEEALFKAEGTSGRADLVVDGWSAELRDAESEFVTTA